MPGRAQPRHDPHHIRGPLDRPDLVEQTQALGREQRAQFGDIHPATVLVPLPLQIKDEAE
jgi:hypothetical protein